LAVPVPLTDTPAGLPVNVPKTWNVALRAPAAVGSNATATWQTVPTGSGVPKLHGLVPPLPEIKSEGSAPVAPVNCSVTGFVPTVTLKN
jgi:hypothetical protein